jgi:hypothetical protein
MHFARELLRLWGSPVQGALMMDNADSNNPDHGGAAARKRPRRNIPPVPPAPGAAAPQVDESAAKPGDKPAAKADPTRFGDWEKNGRCIDF